MITGALVVTAIIGSALISLAISVYIRNSSNALNRHFFFFAVAVAVWIVVNYIAANPLYPHDVQLWSNRVVLVAGGAAVLSMLRFVLQLTDWWARWRKLFTILALVCTVSWVICLSPLVVSDVKVVNNQITNIFGVASWVYFVTLFITTLAVISLFIAARYKLKGIVRNQINVISRSILIALPIILFGNAILPIMGNYELINYTPLMISIIVGTMAYVIIHHRLFDIRPLLARSIAYIFSLGFISVLYAVGLHYISVAMTPLHNGALSNLVTILLIVLALITYPPMKKRFDVITSKLFYKDAYDPQELFNTLNKAHASTLDLKLLMQNTASTLSVFMRTQSMGVFIKDNQEVRYVQTGNFDITRDEIITTCENAYNNKIRRLITDEINDENNIFLRHLRQAGIAALIRFGHQKTQNSEFQGYLVVGPRKSGVAFSTGDLRNLETVSNELAVAIQNALHYEEIQQFNLTLQQKVDKATRKLKATNEKLRRLDETKDEFISMASHQLRTPLTSVKGYVSMVLDGDVGPVNKQQRELLSQSFVSSQRMANLISDLLNLSRINTGKFIIEPIDVDLRKVISSELEQLREMATAKGVKVEYDPPEHFPILSLDDGKIHQVVMNLIDNAIYYTPSGGNITVTLTETPAAVEFRVIDTGIGVPKEVQHHLFTKMYRADNARKARPDGTGLGLFLVKKVVVSQGGAIIFDSVEGKGSTFGFRFNKHGHEPGTSAEKMAAIAAQ